MNLESKQEIKEAVAFKCKICKRYIDLGKCGYHRIETGHKEFEVVYKILEASARNLIALAVR